VAEDASKNGKDYTRQCKWSVGHPTHMENPALNENLEKHAFSATF
jgi:hypothetical protein